jgi:ribosomal protein L37AE/L43A
MTTVKININDGSAHYEDSEGNRIEPKCEKCSKLAQTGISGKYHHIWMCNECLYGKQPTASFKYENEFGTSMPVHFLTYKDKEGK